MFLKPNINIDLLFRILSVFLCILLFVLLRPITLYPGKTVCCFVPNLLDSQGLLLRICLTPDDGSSASASIELTSPPFNKPLSQMMGIAVIDSTQLAVVGVQADDSPGSTQ